MDWGSVINGGMFAVIGVVVYLVILPAVAKSRARTMATQGRFEGGFRVLDGDQPPLPRRWQHGIGQFGPGGELTFRSYRGGLRFLPRDPVTIRVTSVVDPTLRAPGFPGVLRVAYYCRLVTVATETATLQVALVPDAAPWVLGNLVPWTRAAAQPVGAPQGWQPPAAAAPPPATPEGFLPPT